MSDREKIRKELLEEYRIIRDATEVFQLKRKWYDIKEICLYFDISPSMVEGMRKHGDLPVGSVRKIGRLWKYDIKKIDKAWALPYNAAQ